jgi:hypothetical protein
MPGLRAMDLGLGAVESYLDAFGLGIGEEVLQGLQPQAGPVGDCEAPVARRGRT